jgi:uracil-DNA glycosylase
MMNPYLKAMGITEWVRRDVIYPSAQVVEKIDQIQELTQASPEISEIKNIQENQPITMQPMPKMDDLREKFILSLDWNNLEQRIKTCTDCPLHEQRTNTVFGVGNKQAKWLVLGEAPGQDEDKQGEPFVGRAGQLLNSMLFAVGLQRSDIFIANTVKCRPPNNRDPHPTEILSCAPFLTRQIELLKPRLILILGRVAVRRLLQKEDALGKLRGQIHEYQNIPVVITYHPAYLLRSPSEKAKAWEDLQFALSVASPI